MMETSFKCPICMNTIVYIDAEHARKNIGTCLECNQMITSEGMRMIAIPSRKNRE